MLPIEAPLDGSVTTGIYPREPRNKKKANKGSTAPTTFYYVKDIGYLQHEPVLHKLREHKAFAKKLSRALGRGQEGLAKNLEERHEGYRLDHIIKERWDCSHPSPRNVTKVAPCAGTRRLPTRSGISTTPSRSSFCSRTFRPPRASRPPSSQIAPGWRPSGSST